ncbi:MAG: replication initiator protein A [Isosphaeraceae bacterium]
MNREFSENTEIESILPTPENAFKDELNLAEFPIAALTDRIPDGQTTLVFEDRLDQKDGPPIVRRLTIMAPSKHGLPAAVDDEVIVGLIQLTKRRNNFTDPKVAFSRYELIELLGWPQTGPSYRRVEEALHRWVGVVLMYENAWWDNSAKSWVDENFHILENVTLYDRERRKRAGKTATKGTARRGVRQSDSGGDPLPLSSFRWNEVIFRSFQSGNLKQLDLEFYLKLRLPTTKRMFRFLDKRFYRRERLDFDLRTLACEHIGMSRSYKPTELKRRLRPALEELELLGFIEPLSDQDRYCWRARGQWRILFIRGARGWGDEAEVPTPEDQPDLLVEALTARGVTPGAAADLIKAHPSARVRTKIEVFDWLVKNEDKRVGKNPAGYLVASIRADYQVPDDFQPIEEADRLAEAERLAAEAVRVLKDQAAAEAEVVQNHEANVRARWEALPGTEREAIITKVKAENPGLRRWKKLLEPLCLAAMDARPLSDAPIQNQLFPEAKPND